MHLVGILGLLHVGVSIRTQKTWQRQFSQFYKRVFIRYLFAVSNMRTSLFWDPSILLFEKYTWSEKVNQNKQFKYHPPMYEKGP